MIALSPELQVAHTNALLHNTSPKYGLMHHQDAKNSSRRLPFRVGERLLFDSAKFAYKGVKFEIKYGLYTGGEWGISSGLSGYVSHVQSKDLVNWLMIQLGEARESCIESQKERG